MKEILFKLDDFCKANNIDYIVTGTTALDMLGIPASPNDIDIKIFKLQEEQKIKLKELQFLSGLDKENYESTGYSFIISGVKINAITSIEDYSSVLPQTVVLVEYDKAHAKQHLIHVQSAIFALADKMKLKRPKDKTYMLDLINKLSWL